MRVCPLALFIFSSSHSFSSLLVLFSFPSILGFPFASQSLFSSWRSVLLSLLLSFSPPRLFFVSLRVSAEVRRARRVMTMSRR